MYPDRIGLFKYCLISLDPHTFEFKQQLSAANYKW